MNRLYILILLILSGNIVFAQNTSTPPTVDEIKILPVLFQQRSAEYRALCYQAFNLAELRINCIKKRDIRKGHLAIITDLDETILDNSYSEANLIREGKSYSSASWKKWTDLSAATAVPGAVAFLKFVHQKGIEIYYISNRKTDELASTLKNLQKLGLPNADEAHTLLYAQDSPKEVRRQLVMKDHEVVMLLGDNLNDFADVFEKKSIDERFQSTDNFRKVWGSKFIVLPNPVYGEWENALYNYDFKLSPEEKKATRLKLLKGY
ncbi:MAG: 5'-nucleotidase, lipoprotein e(P4) family [Bacteroidetes bacterium]|nr:5'-nucleotidase, lipoprotein e(P4) family [Bacteroidota bacterium]MBU1371637.1 5'-nucleotidase, lipoprotein e(P4) family [Bacteroidota bacterium]MBU1486213.1 5'-nucleotidase, lipoprotein e(P4) family [Bacteroidota bacterium]MBU1760158.1 5'-nucleotidase, lipoprotein e(P4) family [Bacteroidota bacterium]MBU2269473.1 5'-nucleotidase, lipoprotein e(P4) family [Bacteroidota bacterium]